VCTLGTKHSARNYITGPDSQLQPHDQQPICRAFKEQPEGDRILNVLKSREAFSSAVLSLYSVRAGPTLGQCSNSVHPAQQIAQCISFAKLSTRSSQSGIVLRRKSSNRPKMSPLGLLADPIISQLTPHRRLCSLRWQLTHLCYYRLCISLSSKMSDN